MLSAFCTEAIYLNNRIAFNFSLQKFHCVISFCYSFNVFKSLNFYKGNILYFFNFIKDRTLLQLNKVLSKITNTQIPLHVFLFLFFPYVWMHFVSDSECLFFCQILLQSFSSRMWWVFLNYR